MSIDKNKIFEHSVNSIKKSLTTSNRQDLKVHPCVHCRPAGPLQPAPDQGHHRQGRYGPLHPGGAEVRALRRHTRQRPEL